MSRKMSKTHSVVGYSILSSITSNSICCTLQNDTTSMECTVPKVVCLEAKVQQLYLHNQVHCRKGHSSGTRAQNSPKAGQCKYDYSPPFPLWQLLPSHIRMKINKEIQSRLTCCLRYATWSVKHTSSKLQQKIKIIKMRVFMYHM